MNHHLQAYDHLSDEMLIPDIIAGNKHLYEIIVKRYNQRLYRIARSYIKEESLIEDIMQEAYIKAYRNLSSFEQRSKFSTWLTRILINEALQYLRREKQKMSAIEEEQDTISDFNHPEKEYMNTELKLLLEKSIDDLPENYKVVYVMREIEGVSIAETMELLQLSESNVKVRLNRAKEMLRQKLLTQYKSNEIFNFHLSRCDKMVERVFAII